MWKLTIEDDEGQRTTLELANEEYTIGRAEDAGIRLTERNVSRRHARLSGTQELGWTLEDGESYNGIYVNGERVTDALLLKSADVIQLGDYRLELLDQQFTVAAPEVDSRKIRPDRLVMVIGPTPGCEYPLTVERLMVGRAEDAGVSINHASVSRLHCELVSLGQSRWEVLDQGSANGIRINGVDLRRGIIEPGDAFELGDVRLRYVAAGKYLRAGANLSQSLPAMDVLEALAHAAPPPPPPAYKSFAAIASIAAVVAVLVMGAVFFKMQSSANGPATASSVLPMAQSEEEARVMLKTAQGAVADDVEFAHKTLLRIPVDSSLRDTPEFKDIEDKWADAMFAKSASISDPAERGRILTSISENDAVSSEKRKRALELKQDVGVPIDIDRRGAVKSALTGRPTVSVSANSAGTAVGTTATPPPPPVVAAPDKFDMQGQKPSLMGRMASGRATSGELQQLKAICMADGDRSCRDSAVQALKKLKGP